MIQVLGRAFGILEKVAAEPSHAWSIGEMAALIDVSPATCFHIVRTLTELGYLECLGTRKGYRLGPAAQRLSRDASNHPELLEAAAEAVQKTALEIRESVLVAILGPDRRCVLCEAAADREFRLDRTPVSIPDAYHTATGRLLLAALDDNALTRFINAAGMPSREAWGEITTPQQLKTALAQIRTQDCVITETGAYLAQLAFPIHNQNQQTIAALGCYVPRYRFESEHKEHIITTLRQAAQTISGNLLR